MQQENGIASSGCTPGKKESDMPLLMCPNCHSGMKEITRENVQLDMCPECHGVWLDRGELQKLLEAVKTEAESAAPPQAQPPAPTHVATPIAQAPPPQHQPPYAQPPYGQQGYPPPGQPGWHTRYDDSDDDLRKRGGYYPQGYRRKSAIERIFDIFD